MKISKFIYIHICQQLSVNKICQQLNVTRNLSVVKRPKKFVSSYTSNQICQQLNVITNLLVVARQTLTLKLKLLKSVSLKLEGGERGRRPPLPEIVRSSYRRLQ